MTKKAPSFRIALSSILVVLALTLVPAALADKGGAGGTSASVTFSSASVLVGQQYQVNVSGASPNVWISLGAYYMGTDAYWCSHYADSSGNWSCTFNAWSAGSILHTAYERTGTKTYKYRAIGSAYLTVL